MPHIHTGSGEHDHTVSAFIVRQGDDSNWRILLHMHKKIGVLLQPGGHIELTETPWQALAHEIREETGYDVNELELILSPPIIGLEGIDEYPAPFSTNTHAFNKDRTHFHSDAAYAFIAKKEPNIQQAEGESADIRWLTIEELRTLPDTEIYNNVRQLGIYVLSAAAAL